MESGEASSCNNWIKLLDSAMQGRTDGAVELLTKDPSLIHIADSMGDTAFHVAARAGHGLTVSNMIEFLEDGHVEILQDVLCEGNAHGDTPLHLAIKSGHNDVAVRLALTEPRALSIINDDQEKPFYLADQAGIELNFPCVLQAGTDLSMKLARSTNFDNDDNDNDDEEKCTKLYEAIETGKEDVVMEILENDPKMLEHKNTSGWTALHVAAWSGKIGTLKKMVEFKGNNIDQKRLLLKGDINDDTPLHVAVEYGHEKVARYLVKVAPRAIFEVNCAGVSPLCQAIDVGYSDLVRYMTRTELSQAIRQRLLEHAKKVSLAHYALKKRNLAVLQAIVEGLPEVINYPDKKGWKVISYAASKGYFEEFTYILKSFPDSARNIDEDDSYPIHKAVAGGRVDVVKEFLLHCPQALQDTDHKGRDPIEVATLYERKDVLSYLEGKNVDDNGSIICNWMRLIFRNYMRN